MVREALLVRRACVAARWCYRGSGSLQQIATARLRQGAAAGFLATGAGAGALIVSVLGTGTIALMPRAGLACRAGCTRGSTHYGPVYLGPPY